MSNLSITTLCNKKCAYCFAGDSRFQTIDRVNTMSMEIFNSALDYLKRSEIPQLRILGGEPTLHPRFLEMADTGIKRGFHILLFSNGLMSNRILDYLVTLANEQVTVLLNTIHPLENEPDGMLKQQNTMAVLGNRVKLGVNIFSREQQLDYLIDAILKYGLLKEIRLGLAHPLLSKNNTYLHPKFYKDIGLKIFDLLEKAAKSGIKVGFDCGFVPCMFPENSYDKLGDPLSFMGKSCNPILDLLPDGNFISCYPLNNRKKVEINSHITSKQLVEIFNHNLASFSDFGIFPHCRDCELFGNHCSGGCISLKYNRLQNERPMGFQKSMNADIQLSAEVRKVLNVFDVNDRVPPKPFIPNTKAEILRESEIINLIKKEELSKKLSIYIHIPFCQTKCTFCDLYSFPVSKNNAYLKEEYFNSVIKEIEFWGNLTGDKYAHVTTIHFGGGSPMLLSHKLLSKILDKLKLFFHIDRTTEIAIEITADEITDQNTAFFQNENISRIHIGIQTLNENIRKMIGRFDSLSNISGKIEELKKINAIISTDVLFGLPNQSEKCLISDINRLALFGVDGFALYEFQPSKFIIRQKGKNKFFLPIKYENFQMLLIGKDLLNAKGFNNVFFNHYGNKRDKNLYFTYLERNEDCIALGAISDGVINRVNFRHKTFKNYFHSIKQKEIGLEYGYLETEERKRKKRFEVSLMSTSISTTAVTDLTGYYGNVFLKVFNYWKSTGLIKQNNDGFELTASGCFLISNMIEQLRMLNREQVN